MIETLTTSKAKATWICFFAIVLSTKLFGQVVTTEPEYPIPTEPVIVYYDAAQGNGALAGYTGDIYAHTGVITENSSSGSDWKYVVTEWGENTEETKLSRISGDLYSLEISPSIIDYYGVPANEDILELAFVFRNEDGSIVGRGDDGGDIYISVYSDPSAINVISPDTTQIYSIGDDIEINAVSLSAIEMEIYINEELVQTANANSISYTYTADESGDVGLRITANDGQNTEEVSFSIYVRTETQIAELPYPNLVDGINYIDETTVTLVLYAPYKEFVMVKGSFNDWVIGEDYQLYKTTDGNRFWLTIENLVAGQEYAFQYIVDGTITIADPYADKVLDPWNDHYIPESVYPGLMEYPSDKAEGIVSVFQTNQTEYEWEVENFDRPENKDLIVYELLVRDFVANHDYQTLIDTISYLKNLGVNAIELMPVNEFEGNSSWGYNPSFYFAPDKYYGTKNDLKQFIDVCHQNGIAVIMDMVLNHSYGQSPFVQLYFDGSAGEYGQPTPENPWYNETSPNPTYYWGFDFNHESPQTQELVDRVTSYWLEEYKFDGFRFDFTKGFTNTPGEGWSYDQARIDILKRMSDEIWNTAPGAYVILEHLTDNSEEKVLAEYGMLLWGNMNHAYGQMSMGYEDGWEFTNASHTSRGWEVPHLVSYMESHDEERQMYRNITWGNGTPIYDITDPKIALSRSELTSLFFFTIPGPKMIWQFGEMGYDISIDYDCRVCEKPILWEYLDDENRKQLYGFYSNIINLRHQNQIFSEGEIEIDDAEAVKHLHLTLGDSKVFIVGNFGITTNEAVVDFGQNTEWFEYFSGARDTATLLSFNMQPGEYRLYSNIDLGSPSYESYPKAVDLGMVESVNTGDTIFASYSFIDYDGDEEGETIVQWYMSDTESDTIRTPMDGANGDYYVVNDSDLGSYISYSVQPVSQGTSNNTGLTVYSPISNSIVPPAVLPIKVYPNPTSNRVSIHNMYKVSEVNLFDMSGKIIETWNTENRSYLSIDVSAFQTGLYILKFIKQRKVETQIIVKL